MSFTYKGLTAQYTRHIITAEEADRQIQRLLQQNPRITAVTDRPTELGDEVVLDYAGFCDGVQFPAAPQSARLWFWAAAASSPALRSSSWTRSAARRFPFSSPSLSSTMPKTWPAKPRNSSARSTRSGSSGPMSWTMTSPRK